MKPLIFFQHVVTFTLLLYAWSAHAQDDKSRQTAIIQPSPIVQIKKVDPNDLSQLFSSIRNDGENELEEELSRNNRRIKFKLPKTTSADAIFSSPNSSTSCPPLVGTSFEGNPLTPFFDPVALRYATSECNIAISNSGKMLSISNGWMRYYNQNGVLTFSDSLYHFVNSLIDVHVLYDPKQDRFVFITQYGYTNFVNAFQVFGIAIAFSKTNNPADGWNYYFFPDGEFNDNSIGDYPLLGMTDDEVFITDLRFNKGGNLTHSYIVQINKADGYSGDASLTSQFYKVKLSSTTKGTVIPASGGSTTSGPNMHFVMGYESGHPSNKYYAFEITNTIASGQAVLLTYGPITSNITYSESGTSLQPGGIPLFGVEESSGDDYLQNAFFEDGVLHFCQNSLVDGKAGIILGRIKGFPGNLSCTAKTVSDPDLYLAFPSIVYAGYSSSGTTAILGIQHTGEFTYPGLSAVYVNGNFDISDLIAVKNGNDTINSLWGDYSGACVRYNHPGEVWFEGQYGSSVFPRINWIAKLTKPTNCDDPFNAAPMLKVGESPEITIYPNPASTSVFISFKLDSTQDISLKIVDANGNLIKMLTEGRFEKGIHELNWNTGETRNGIYFLQLVSGDHVVLKEISIIK